MKPTKEELAAARAQKKAEAEERKLRAKKRDFFQKGWEYETAGDMAKAILCYEKVIDGAANLRRDYIYLKSLNKLLRFYRKEKNIEEEKRVIRIGLEWNKEDAKLQARLDYLESNQSTGTLPTKRIVVTLQEEPKGYKYQELLKNMIEKYWSKQTGGYFASEEEKRDTDEFFAFSAPFQETYDKAEAAEAGNNYIEAARLYETLVANRFYSCKAYDRLIVIYNKAKLYDVVEEVLEEAIGQAQQNVFSQNDEPRLIERWGERLAKLRERQKAQAKTEKKKEPQISPELVEMQKHFHTIESDYGKILITMIDNEVWFNGRDVCFAIGYTDPKRPLSEHCRNAQMIKYPTLMANGKPTARTGKFITMKDICRMITGRIGTFANEENLRRLHSLEDWLKESEKEYVKEHRGVVNVTFDKEALAELEVQTQESQSVLAGIFNDDNQDVLSSVPTNLNDTKTLLHTLLTKDVWTKCEVEEICKEKGLKYNVVLEQINDYAYSLVEDSVVEEDGDKIYVTTDYRKELS